MHRVVALARSPQSTFELACAAQVFGIERPGLPARYAFSVCAERPGRVSTCAGYDMLVTDGLDALDRADTVIIPGWLPTGEPPAPAVVRALRHAHSRGARVVSMPPHREGGQLQYSAPHPAQIDGTLAPLLEWIIGRLGEPVTVESMAAHAGVSTRTLARRFADQLGTSPGQWLLTQRIATARDLLESSDLPLDAVARRVGLSSATNLRRRFLNTLGTTPGAYRRAFRAKSR
ncbi:helix-turn-helix domain-containing protein [Streptosporangium sp. NPDC051022]|uniref:helix-turn-helix domain-containing protein n=1 Tax=Streptosporangium sp. NPDC051022 TaxID=3155752 RepID=UPI00341CD7AF